MSVLLHAIFVTSSANIELSVADLEWVHQAVHSCSYLQVNKQNKIINSVINTGEIVLVWSRYT